MALDKRILSQYLNEKQEIIELHSKIERLSSKIPKLESRIAEIEEGHTVKDKVRGGEGGLQSFVIEGVPYGEYNDKKADLEFAKRSLKQRIDLVNTLETQLILRTKEVEQFISGIDDSLTRRILRMRVIDGLKWNEIADRVGGGNSESCVKMIYQRFLEKK